jgi:hypothetical protein
MDKTDRTGPTSLDREIFDLINQIRTNPKSFAPHLENIITKYTGNILSREEGKTRLKTKEGSSACIEALEYINKVKISSPL